MSYFVTSDTHFGHTNILKIGNRPFNNIEEMNDEIIHQINSTVPRNNILIIAGDFCWYRPGKWRALIRCKNVHFVIGNHDRPNYCKYFSWSGLAKMIKINDIKCYISHYCHAFWPNSHHGSFHVYGHHHHQREETLDTIWPERRSMDIGVDAAYHRFGVFRPFKDQEIYDILIKRKGHDPISWYEKYQERFKK